MNGTQSDAAGLRGAITRLETGRKKTHAFSWYHPVLLPVPGAAHPRAAFFDRKDDAWIQVAPIVHSPPVELFDARQVVHDHGDPDTFMLVGSFHVILDRSKDGWAVSIESILGP